MNRFLQRFGLLLALFSLCSAQLFAETVAVKYRGEVDLSSFRCESISGSSVVSRICYSSCTSTVVAGIGGSYYDYCDVPANIVNEWLAAPSKGGYFNARIKRRYSCR